MGAELVAALDVGGTSVKAALFDGGPRAGRSPDGEPRVVHSLRAPTARARPERAAETLADQLGSIVAELESAAGARAAAVGVAVPGIVDDERGIGRFSANLGWRDAPLRELLTDRLDRPVRLMHDVRAGALAESRLGAARGFGDVAFIAVGTGIAAGLILGGRPHAGGGYAGEVGHIDVGHELPCTCGSAGCLEAVASAASIARRYTDRTGRAVEGALGVVTAARSGDADAAVVLQEATDALGAAVRTLARLVAPQVVVLGGGLFAAGAFLLDPLRAWLSAHLGYQPVPELRVARLGDEAGCLGAGLLALDALS